MFPNLEEEVVLHSCERLGHFRLTCLPVQGGVELVDRGRDLEPGLEDGLLPLEPDVFRPANEAGEVPLGLDVAADAEVPGPLLEERVHHPLHLGLLDGQGGGRNLLPFLLTLGDETISARA